MIKLGLQLDDSHIDEEVPGLTKDAENTESANNAMEDVDWTN